MGVVALSYAQVVAKGLNHDLVKGHLLNWQPAYGLKGARGFDITGKSLAELVPTLQGG